MERLTFEGNFCEIARCKEVKCPYDTDCSQKQVWERLKQYEDTGLTPAEVHSISGEWCAMMSVLNSMGSYDRLRELAVADQEGRVLILPCKLGTKVYRIRYEIADYPDDPEPEIATTWFTPEYREDIGKTVFLTREEAEKALAEMEGKKDG